MNSKKIPLKRRRLTLLFFCGVVTSIGFMNCSPGFKVIEGGRLELASTGLTVDLKFDENVQDVMTSANPSVGFTVKASDPSYVLKCFVNGVQTEKCVSPISLSALQDGDITVRIAAENTNGRQLTEISKAIKLDRAAPVITVTLKPADQIGAQNTSVSFSVIDNVSSSADITVQCALDTAAFATCTSPQPYDKLAQGAHSIKLKAIDKAGNASAVTSVNFAVVIGIPTVVISQAPAAFINVKTASFTFSGSSANATITGYECSINGGSAFAACTSPQSYPGLTDGPYNFAVRAKDNVNQTSGSATAKFTVDTTPPSTPSVSSNLTSPSAQLALSLTFSSSDTSGIAGYQCSQDGGTFTTCTSPKPYAALTPGSHTFRVKSTDQAGNSSAEGIYIIVIDNAAPDLNITAQPTNPTIETSASFSFTATDSPAGIKTIECQLDTEATASSCTSPKVYSVTKGNRTFVVRATDNAGNSVAKTYSWTVNDPVVVPLTGAQLYTNNCASCHGQLDVSVKRDRTASQILGAMNDPATGMAVFKTLLSQADVEAIAAALSSTGGQPSSVLSATQNGLVANRMFVTSVFEDIFANPSTGVIYSDIRAEVDKWLFTQTAQFGGGCDLGSTASGQDCGPVNVYFGDLYASEHLSSTPIQLPVSTIRQSYMLKACENIASVTPAMNYVRAKMGVVNTAELDAKNLTDLYLLFYRDEGPSAERLKILQDLNNDLKANNESLDNRWRAIFSYVCELSDWQSI